MNKPPFLSVIIPTYNCADYLERALNSVFSQTYQDFEIIVVDNSSTDHTKDVLSSFNNERLMMNLDELKAEAKEDLAIIDEDNLDQDMIQDQTL